MRSSLTICSSIYVVLLVDVIEVGFFSFASKHNYFYKDSKLLNIEADMFKILDGSHMEISFYSQNQEEDEEPFNITLMLDYRVYDIRPKTYSFKEIDLPEDASEVLKDQCLIFKKKPLHKAFKDAFMNDIGMYKLVQQLGPKNTNQDNAKRKPKRFRPNKHNYKNDDTFLPEDCSDQGDDDGIED